MVFDGSPSWTMIRWYGWKKGLHISKKSRFRIVGITISSSSFKTGVGLTEASAAIDEGKERNRELQGRESSEGQSKENSEREREREREDFYDFESGK